jgi:hypothetical protein
LKLTGWRSSLFPDRGGRRMESNRSNDFYN